MRAGEKYVAVNMAARVELTFELPDNAKECFYEEIEKGTASSLEFQVGDGSRCSLGKNHHSHFLNDLHFFFS